MQIQKTRVNGSPSRRTHKKSAVADRPSSGAVDKILAGIQIGAAIYFTIQELRSRTTPQQINDRLRDQNGGRDLKPADAEKLARVETQRNRVAASLFLANQVSTGVAVAMDNSTAGKVATGLHSATVAYGFVEGYLNAKDEDEALRRQPKP